VLNQWNSTIESQVASFHTLADETNKLEGGFHTLHQTFSEIQRMEKAIKSRNNLLSEELTIIETE
jgi:hypothetical protein